MKEIEDEEEKIMGLEIGEEEYIEKKLEKRELIERIREVIRSLEGNRRKKREIKKI